MVAFMAFNLHSGLMAVEHIEGPAQTAARSAHEQLLHADVTGQIAATVAGTEELASSADPHHVGHDHSKSPCKSRCCGSTCTLALLDTPAVMELGAKPVSLIAFGPSFAIKSNDLSGLERPPRRLLTV